MRRASDSRIGIQCLERTGHSLLWSTVTLRSDERMYGECANGYYQQNRCLICPRSNRYNTIPDRSLGNLVQGSRRAAPMACKSVGSDELTNDQG
jgi:hypothetical protein